MILFVFLLDLFVQLLFTSYYNIYSEGKHLGVDEGLVAEEALDDPSRGSTMLPLTLLTSHLNCKFSFYLYFIHFLFDHIAC